MPELSSRGKNFFKTPTNIYAILYNFCNRPAVTIQTNTLSSPDLARSYDSKLVAIGSLCVVQCVIKLGGRQTDRLTDRCQFREKINRTINGTSKKQIPVFFSTPINFCTRSTQVGKVVFEF